MKNIKKIITVALIGLFSVGAAGCNMIEKTDEAIKKSPVAKFNNETITRGQLDEKMADYIAEIKKQYGENYVNNAEAKETLLSQKKQVLEQMINEKIIYKKASEKNLTATDEEISKKIDEFKKDMDEEILKNLYGFKEGYNDPEFKEYIKSNITLEKLINEETKDLKVEDKEIQDYYNSNQNKFTEKPNRYNVARIVVNTEDEAKKVKERIEKGEDFAKIAKEVSIDTSSKDKGGDLGFLEYNDTNYGSNFMINVMGLKEGAISNPFQDTTGWNVVKMIKKEEYPVKKLETVKDEIKKTLLEQKKSQKFNEIFSKWKEEAKVKYYEKNLI
ncbi:peptidylprolyl isomerase [Clostridium prolinivorans]|uniref:peptidylprolyl isomerase n=1 Tax=Clostridium prolinivorans TaxID=2769420 RepID=UPI000FD979DA|nr:peptidylprolyl isomerase [Clostridium prolinivorans]